MVKPPFNAMEKIMRELSVNETQEVNGGIVPILVGIGVRAAAGAAVRAAGRVAASRTARVAGATALGGAGYDFAKGVANGVQEGLND